MAVEAIQVHDAADSRLDEYRNVRDPELLHRRGLFVAEGRRVVERVLQAPEGSYRVKSLLLNDASFAILEGHLPRLPDVPIYVCSTTKLSSTVGFDFHRGCLALVERPGDRSPCEVMSQAEVVLVLEGIADPDNVGSAFRNAAAFGAGGVLLSPTCCDPLYRKAIRTSMGTVFRVPFARFADWPNDLGALKDEGFTLVALTPRQPAINLSAWKRRPGRKIALLVGREGDGLTTGAETCADERVQIGMQPGVDSLNLATATGIALYSLTV